MIRATGVNAFRIKLWRGMAVVRGREWKETRQPRGLGPGRLRKKIPVLSARGPMCGRRRLVHLCMPPAHAQWHCRLRLDAGTARRL